MTDDLCDPDDHSWVLVGAYSRMFGGTEMYVEGSEPNAKRVGLLYLCQDCNGWTTFEPDPENYVDPEHLTET